MWEEGYAAPCTTALSVYLMSTRCILHNFKLYLHPGGICQRKAPVASYKLEELE